MLCDIEKDALDKAVADLRATNADVDGVVADVSLKDNLQRAADETIARFGKVHILVNNAGVGGGGDYGSWNDAGWNWVIGVNLMSVVWGIEIFEPLIEAHGEGGQIVSTASIAGMIAATNPSYDVTKFGVVALSEGLRPKLAARGIGVSVLCPGIIRTNILDSRRHIPGRFAGQIPETEADGPGTEMLQTITNAIASGIDPLYVGELVREAIEGDWPHIFTDLQFEPYIEARFAAIREGFDRIRDRVPRH
jgi:NAD(P)-dependent dehydrogenase (short-subunit alcohol dehydrogenase family)